MKVSKTDEAAVILIENVREFLKKFRQFRAEADKDDYSSEFNASVDKTFIRLKQTLRALEEKIDELQENEKNNRSSGRQTSGKKPSDSHLKNRQKDAEQETKSVQKGTLKSADFDLLGLDFGVQNSPKTTKISSKTTPDKPVSADILDLDFDALVSAQKPKNNQKTDNFDTNLAEHSTTESAEKEGKQKEEPDFFDRIAIRQDYF